MIPGPGVAGTPAPGKRDAEPAVGNAAPPVGRAALAAGEPPAQVEGSVMSATMAMARTTVRASIRFTGPSTQRSGSGSSRDSTEGGSRAALGS